MSFNKESLWSSEAVSHVADLYMSFNKESFWSSNVNSHEVDA